jgi:hypothetical protein
MVELIRIEAKKLFRHPLFWYSLLVLIGLYVLLMLKLTNGFLKHYNIWVEFMHESNAWDLLLHRFALNLSLVSSLILLVLILVVAYIESQHHNWRRLLALPQSLFHILLSKLYLVFLVFLVVYSLLWVSTLAIAKPIIIEKYDFLFKNEMYQENGSKYFLWYFFSVFAFSKFIFFHFWLSTRLKENQFFSFLIGCLGLFMPYQYLPYGAFFSFNSTMTDVLIVAGVAVLYCIIAIYFLKKESALRYFM